MAGNVGKVYYAFSDQEMLFDSWYVLQYFWMPFGLSATE